MRAKSVQPKFTGVPKMVIFDSGCGQTLYRELYLRWVVHQGAIFGVSIPCLEVGKVTQMGKMDPKNGRN
jgi:hypothetical protein